MTEKSIIMAWMCLVVVVVASDAQGWMQLSPPPSLSSLYLGHSTSALFKKYVERQSCLKDKGFRNSTFGRIQQTVTLL